MPRENLSAFMVIAFTPWRKTGNLAQLVFFIVTKVVMMAAISGNHQFPTCTPPTADDGDDDLLSDEKQVKGFRQQKLCKQWNQIENFFLRIFFCVPIDSVIIHHFFFVYFSLFELENMIEFLFRRRMEIREHIRQINLQTCVQYFKSFF